MGNWLYLEWWPAMKKTKRNYFIRIIYIFMLLFMLFNLYIFWIYIEQGFIRYMLLFLWSGFLFFSFIIHLHTKHQMESFTDELYQLLDSFISNKKPDNRYLLDDTPIAHIQRKLMQYYNITQEETIQIQRNKKVIQEMISDISHQVKTPMSNIRLYTNILKQNTLSESKEMEFWQVLEAQINKLEFLLHSLVKMSRLESETFTLHIKEANLYDTLIQAINDIWVKAEKKNIQLNMECSRTIQVKHDTKWTAEAFTNILDNAIKYTPSGGKIKVSVHPSPFYTKIEIQDSGIGIEKEDYNNIFKRFYRGQKVAAEEGIGLGLYLARKIIMIQKGYITVVSELDKGSTFSIYLLS